MTGKVFEELSRRGFVQQVTEPEPLQRLFDQGPTTFYVGFDPTADSLHAGSLMPIMGMMQMQRFGHRPIAILGSGTAMVGDPSGKTEMRKIISRDQIVANGEKIKKQLGRFLDFENDRALLVDNYDWLGGLKYIEFLRDIGCHFSVNRMLTYETYKIRLERGLSFLEFNYQLLQAYDFLELYNRYNCRLQMGGDDQWANILAGADLIRRVKEADAFGLTFPLLVTATGGKMGKTESGAVWLDAEKTSPYEYYQYWVNVDDRDVHRFLNFFTLLPAEEIEAVQLLQGAELNAAKVVLAFEATQLNHGEQAAREAYISASAAFGGRSIPAGILPSSRVPRTAIQVDDSAIPGADFSAADLAQSPRLIDVLEKLALVGSRGEGRRLIQQGGVSIHGERVAGEDKTLSAQDVQDGIILLRLGKKRYFRLNIVA